MKGSGVRSTGEASLLKGAAMTPYQESLKNRLLSKLSTRVPGMCWEFQGSCIPLREHGQGGYGKMADSSGGWKLAHRIAYTVFIGPIPDGLKVLHTCDNPLCCNPAHLYAGTSLQNAHDREARNRCAHARGERINTAKLTQEEVLEIYRSTATITSLAVLYNVHFTTIARIRKGAIWSHVTCSR